MANVKFGKEIVVTKIDSEGSTMTDEIKYHNGLEVKPTHRRVEMRVKVTDKTQELQEYLKFSDSLTSDKLDPVFRIEYGKDRSDPSYYVVKCWTTLLY